MLAHHLSCSLCHSASFSLIPPLHVSKLFHSRTVVKIYSIAKCTRCSKNRLHESHFPKYCKQKRCSRSSREDGVRHSGWKPGVKMFSGSRPLFGCFLGAAHIQTSTCVLHSSAPFMIREPALHAAGHLRADSLLMALKCVALLEK